jgi:hypothetical protein
MYKKSTGGMVIPLGITSSYRRGIHRKNSYSTGNKQLRDEESTGRMVIPQGISSSGTRNPPEEWLFRRE